MTTTTPIVAALVAALALAGVAAAAPGCPDCHMDPPPIKNDCGYTGAHQGAAAHDDTEATNDGVCVANAHHKQGPWVKLDLCFESFVDAVAHRLGLHLELQLYASQDGVDAKSDDVVAGHTAMSQHTPVQAVDDASWQALGQVHAKVDPVLASQGVDTRDAPVGGDQLPHTYVDACAQAKVYVAGC
jgi:hypothetical protein